MTSSLPPGTSRIPHAPAILHSNYPLQILANNRRSGGTDKPSGASLIHLFFLDPRHHPPQLFADLLDRMAPFAPPGGLERRRPRLVLQDPLPCKLPAANLFQY